MEMELTQILESFGQLGFSVVFLWLFVREMRMHEETRQAYRRDLRDIARLRSDEDSLFRDEERTNSRKTELP